MLTEAQIIKFQEIYERQLGKPISREFAIEYGLKLVAMMRAVYSPIPVEPASTR